MQEPYTRSRTNLFLSYRDSSSSRTRFTTPFLTQGEYETTGLLDAELGLGTSGDSNGGVEPPRWVGMAEGVEKLLLSVRPKLDRLDKLHSKHLLPGFKDRSSEEHQIAQLSNSITSDFRSCQSLIRQIAQLSVSLLAPPAPAPSSSRKGKRKEDSEVVHPKATREELMMAANVQMGLAAKVQDLSTLFRKKQSTYLRALRERGGPISSPALSASHSHSSSYDPLLSAVADQSLSQSLLHATATPRHDQVNQRTEEIEQLARSIGDLADMFKDLQSLVVEQGTLLDRVDYHVEVLVGETKGAVRELEAATRHQKRSGKCQIIFLLLLLVIGAAILLAYKPRGGESIPTGEVRGDDVSGSGRAEEEVGVR